MAQPARAAPQHAARRPVSKAPVAAGQGTAQPASNARPGRGAPNPLWQAFALGGPASRTGNGVADSAETQAEQVAERALRTPAAPAPPPPGATPPAAAGPGAAAPAAPAVPAAVRGPLGPGRPLSPPVRAFFEPRLAATLGDVQVHDNPQAAHAAGQLHARAFAVGPHIAFAQGQYAPGSPAGRHLLAHELAHVLQQRGNAPRVARQPDPAKPALNPGPAPDDVEARWKDAVADQAVVADEASTATGRFLDTDAAQLPAERAKAERRFLVLEALQPKTQDELDDLVLMADDACGTEDQTLATLAALGTDTLIGDPLDHVHAFPEAWAERVEKSVRPVLDVATMHRQRDDAWRELTEAGAALPPWLAAHGLPVDFDTAMDLQHYTLTRAALGFAASHPLHRFATAMQTHTNAWVDAMLAERYAAAVRNLVAAVRDGSEVIDPGIFPEYAHDRQWAPSPDELTRWPTFPTSPSPLPGAINPYEWERRIFAALWFLRVPDSLAPDAAARDEYARRQAEADVLIAGLDRWQRLYRAKTWADELGYSAYVHGKLWDEFKNNVPGMLEDMVVEGVKFAAIQAIPVVGELYDLYLIGKAIASGVGALMELVDAEDVAMSAQTVVGLQHASAHLALVSSTAMIKLIGSALEGFGSWAAFRAAVRARAPKLDVASAGSKAATAVDTAAVDASKAAASADDMVAKAARLAQEAAASQTAADAAAAQLEAAVGKLWQALRSSGSRPMAAVGGVLDPVLLARMVEVGYYAAKRGITRFNAFVRTLRKEMAAAGVDASKLDDATLQRLERAFNEGVDLAAAEAPLVTRYDPNLSVAPGGWRLARPAEGEFPDLEHGVVLEFPGGERAFRQAGSEGGVTIESKLGAGSRRQGYEAELFSRGEMDPAYVQSNMERAHAHGQGTGYESPYEITYAPREVNQALQNTGIELYLRQLARHDVPGLEFNLVTTTRKHPLSRRLREIEYRIDATLNGQRRQALSFKIEVSDSISQPKVDITDLWLNPDLAATGALPMNDLPLAIKDRLRFIMTRGASFPAEVPP